MTTSLSLSHQMKNKQTNKQKSSAQLSPYTNLHTLLEQRQGGRNQTEERNQPWSLGKGDLKHNKLKKIIKRQRNTTQIKEQTRNTEVQTNEDEIGKLCEKEFRILIVKMIKNLEKKTEKMQESINKDLDELKNEHTEKNNTITEIKNTLEEINSRIFEAEELISELEDKMVEITSEEQNKEKEWKELRIVSETSGTISNAPTFEL